MVHSDEAIAAASLAEIKTMLTFCVRGERFCDGHWGAMVSKGRIGAILRRLEFRRTRPGQEFPHWLIQTCCDDPHEDPGHEAEWEQRRQSNRRQSTEDVAHQESFVELIIQLRPIEKLPPAIPPQPGWPWHLRKPAQCPLGISCHEFLPHCSDS